MKVRIKKTGKIVEALTTNSGIWHIIDEDYIGFIPKQDAEIVDEPKCYIGVDPAIPSSNFNAYVMWEWKKEEPMKIRIKQCISESSWYRNIISVAFEAVQDPDDSDWWIVKVGDNFTNYYVKKQDAEIVDPYDWAKSPIIHDVLAKKEEQMKEFDVDGWWNRPRPSHHAGCIDGYIKLMEPLYRRMREWGFDCIEINWEYNRIYIQRKQGDATYPRSMFIFKDIRDFPRALKEAFKWMYENRKNKMVCKDCGKDVSGAYQCAARYSTPKNMEYICYNCLYKFPKLKCDSDGPCDWLKKYMGGWMLGQLPIWVKETTCCPKCGEQRR